MDKPERTTRERIGSSRYFLGCFGFPRKKYSEKPVVSPNGGEKKRRKKNRWFSWSKLRLKNGEIKPAPIDNETQKSNSNAKNAPDKQKTIPVISRMTDRKKNILAGDDKVATLETKETNRNEQRDTISDRPKAADPLRSSQDDTCPKWLTTWVRGKPDPAKTGKTGSNPTEERKKPNRVGKFDPVIGISIIMLTLAIMLIWGRMCAILCASAWCYLLPRLRDAAAAKRKRYVRVSDIGDSGFNYETYKRKVILDGFLGRNKRASL